MDCNTSEAEASVSGDSVFPVNESESVNPEERVTLQLLRQGIKETAEENSAFAKEVAKLLQELGINCRTLPNDIREGLEKVASLLQSESLYDLDFAVQCICHQEKVVNEKKKKRDKKKMALKQDVVQKKCNSLQCKVDDLERAVNSLTIFSENARVTEHAIYSNTLVLSKKLKDYRHTMELLESELERMDIVGFYPEEIEAKYNKYLECLGELAQVEQSLAKYSDLPPNLLQAKALLQAKEREYNEISQAFLDKTRNDA